MRVRIVNSCEQCGRVFSARDIYDLRCPACRKAPKVKAGNEALGCAVVLVLFIVVFGCGVAVAMIASWRS